MKVGCSQRGWRRVAGQGVSGLHNVTEASVRRQSRSSRRDHVSSDRKSTQNSSCMSGDGNGVIPLLSSHFSVIVCQPCCVQQQQAWPLVLGLGVSVVR